MFPTPHDTEKTREALALGHEVLLTARRSAERNREVMDASRRVLEETRALLASRRVIPWWKMPQLESGFDEARRVRAAGPRGASLWFPKLARGAAAGAQAVSAKRSSAVTVHEETAKDGAIGQRCSRAVDP